MLGAETGFAPTPPLLFAPLPPHPCKIATDKAATANGELACIAPLSRMKDHLPPVLR